jgi:hypothetical protein
MRRSNVALRLQASLLEEARRVSDTEGVSYRPCGPRIISLNVQQRAMW